jgi:hypothetical protein
MRGGTADGMLGTIIASGAACGADGNGAACGGATALGAALGVSDPSGRSLSGRGGGIGAGRDRTAAGSIVRRNAGTGGIGGGFSGEGGGTGGNGAAFNCSSGAASGSAWRNSGDAGLGTGPRVGSGGGGSRRGITTLEGLTWP